MDAGAKTRFEQAATVLGLDAEAKELAWRRIADLGMTPDDPTVVFLAVAGILEKAASDVPRAAAAVSQEIENAARRAVGPVAEAAMVATRASMTRGAEAVVEGARNEIRDAAAKAFDELSARSRVKTTVLSILGVLIVAVVAAGLGYGAGRGQRVLVERQGQALALRADAEHWFDLVAANGDLAKTLRENCASGAKAAYLVQGVRACSVPLWLERPPGAAPASEALSVSAMLDWTNMPGFLWAALGVLAGVLLRKLLVEIGARGSIRWLLDL
jgi:hypothetical protein